MVRLVVDSGIDANPWWWTGWNRCIGRIPIKEWPVEKGRPGDTIVFFAFEIVRDALLALEDGDQLDRVPIRGIAPELRGHKPLDSGFDGCIDDACLCTNTWARNGRDDGVLALEGGDEGCLAVVCLVDLDVGRICRGALLAGEDRDVQSSFCIEGRKDRGTEVAASLKCVSIAAARGEQWLR